MFQPPELDKTGIVYTWNRTGYLIPEKTGTVNTGNRPGIEHRDRTSG